MKSVQRLVFITIGCLVVIATGLWAIRQLGLSQSFSSFDHPIMRSHEQLRFWNSEIVREGYYPIVNISLNPDKKWSIAKAKSQKWLEDEFTITEQSLEDYLKQNSPRIILLNVVANTPDSSLEELAQLLKQAEASDRIIVLSPFVQILRKFRKFAPRLLFAAHLADVMKLEIKATFFIETATELKSDFYIFNLHHFKPSLRLIQEIRRQKKKVLLFSEPDKTIDANFLKLSNGLILNKEFH